MVLGVCRHTFGPGPETEDVCQATFLILSQKAKGAGWRHSIANWLYTTARNLALNARTAARRRATREQSAAVPEAMASIDVLSARELFDALDEELQRVPVIYREPLVLFFLEGLSREQIARRLAVPVGTVKTRLERGKQRLGDALAKRGIVSGFALMALAATSRAGAAPKVVDSVLAAVGGSPSPTAVALAKGVGMNGVLAQPKLVVVAVAALMISAVMGLGFASPPRGAEPTKPPTKPDEPKPTAKGEPRAAERTVTGKVVDADGKPVRAQLHLIWVEGKPTALGETKADGTFRVTLPPQRGEFADWLVATAAGHGHDFLIPALNTAPEVTLKLLKERPIRGRLLDQQGKPIAGATVSAHRFSTFASAAAASNALKQWATVTDAARDVRRLKEVLPQGERNVAWRPDAFERDGKADVRARFSAVSDKDGRFEIRGTGANQLVTLYVRGPGAADTEAVVLNGEGFDADAINKSFRDADKKLQYPTGVRWVFYGPSPEIVMAPEKLVRGTVTDADGKPKGGVSVALARVGDFDLNPDFIRATTDKDGKYEIRGARKHKGYAVEVPADTVTGLLPCRGTAEDTAGFEPITIDLKCVKGVVITGIVTDKATGKPVRAHLVVDVLANNPFVKKYPPHLQTALRVSTTLPTGDAGEFRFVSAPGPVMLSVLPADGGGMYKQAGADPKHPDLFSERGGLLIFDSYGGGLRPVQGSLCRVIDTKATDAVVTVNVELEPAPKVLVKVVDADGKPVTGAKASGVTHIPHDRPMAFPDVDTVSVFNPDPKNPRFIAVVHEQRKLVGTFTLTAGAKDPVVRLGRGGSVTGRAVDADGKPLAGLTVDWWYTHYQVGAATAFTALTAGKVVTTDANGQFRIDAVFPNEEFQLLFKRGKSWCGPGPGKAAKHTIAGHGDALKLGDVKLDLPKNGEE
jgi:RNA polymerase sigma factor (sigma-70 family)